MNVFKYNSFVKENFSQEIYYHGSPNKFNDIISMKRNSGESKFLGEGIYITNNYDVAKIFSKEGYIYTIELKEKLKPLEYYKDLKDRDAICSILLNSGVYELEYIGENIQEDNISGRNFIEMIKREKLDVNDVLLLIGYNSIVAPLNKINEFRGMSDDVLNINIIKSKILVIKSIEKVTTP